MKKQLFENTDILNSNEAHHPRNSAESCMCCGIAMCNCLRIMGIAEVLS